MRYGAGAFASLAAVAAIVYGCRPAPAMRSPMADAERQAQGEINDATRAVKRMWMEPGVAALLRAAKGVLVVPAYGRGAYFLGGQGGRGVLVVRRSATEWSEPAFYSLGGASFGLGAGGQGGPLALILMSDDAVGKFRDNGRTWQLAADTGLTIVGFAGTPSAASGNSKADIVMWSGVRGLSAGISAAATYITPSATLDDAYYHRLVTNRQILTGAVVSRYTAGLREALAGGSSASYR